MKSVLFVSLMNGAAWGGSEELWYQTALYAAQNGYKTGCAFYAWPQKKERIQKLKEAGCRLYLFSNKGRNKSTFWERMQFKVTKRLVRYRSRTMPIADYDITVINLGYLEVIERYWKHFHPYVKNYALLFHVHSENDPVPQYGKPLLKKWMENAKHNLFASEPTKDFFERQLGMKFSNAGILINPITFKAPKALTTYPPLHEGNYVFAMLATLEVRRKAQDNLITALSSAKWKARAWQLHLYGGGESEQKLKELIAANDVNEKVILKGHTQEVKGALAEAHLLLQITHIDAMPLAVIEALAMGRPVVASRIGDMPKWVREGVNGWISPDASVKEIDATLERAWQQREQWEEMGKASFKIFKEDFPASPEAYLLEQLAQ